MSASEIAVITGKVSTRTGFRYTFDYSSIGVGDWFIAKGGAQTRAAKTSIHQNPIAMHMTFKDEPCGRVSTKFTRIK